MEEVKAYLKAHPRILGGILLLMGLWITELVYRKPIEIINSGKGELSISEKYCVLSVMFVFVGLVMLIAPKKLEEWAEEKQKRKKLNLKDIAVGAVFIAPGLMGYFALKWYAESKGFVFE